MAREEIGVVKNSSGQDRKVDFDEKTGEIWVVINLHTFSSDDYAKLDQKVKKASLAMEMAEDYLKKQNK